MIKRMSNDCFIIELNDSGDIKSLSCFANRNKNILAKNGMCVWLKCGVVKDLVTDVLSNFMESFHTAAYQKEEEDKHVITFSRESSGIRLIKKIELIGKSLKITAEVENTSDYPVENLQLEFHNVFSTPVPDEREMDCSVMYPDKQLAQAKIIRSECFGQRFVQAFPCQSASHRLGRLDKDFHFKIDSTGDCEALTAMIMGRIFMRGFNSRKFTLNPGEKYCSGFELTIETESINKFIPEQRKLTSSSKSSSVMELFKGDPVFHRRWSHFCLQYDMVDPEIIRRVIGDLLVPLGYTGIILELNRGVVTDSHPELAAEWAMPISEIKSLAEFIRSHGMEVGFEFNTPGHQNETGIAEVMPELLEPNPDGYKKATLCVSNPRARKIISEIFCELIGAIEPDLINLGADEAQFDGYGKAFGNCPLCRDKQAYSLFAEYIQWLYSKVEGTECAMFGDMFIQSEQFGAACTGNGSADDVWKSLELIPPEISILDWHYFPADKYDSLGMFKDKGFKVWPVTAFNLIAMRNFLAHAEQMKLDSALHTTWTVPSQEKFAIESVVWAGIYHWLGTSAPDHNEIENMTKEFCRKFWKTIN